MKCCFIKAEAVCKLLSLVTLSCSPPRTACKGLVSGALPPLGAWEGMLEPLQREGLAGQRVCFGGCRKERVLVSHYRP